METSSKQSEAVEVLWRLYRDARLAHESAQEEEVRLKRLRVEAEDALIDGMVNAKMLRAEIDGRFFSLRRQVNISVTRENEDDVRGWLSLTLGPEAAQDYLEVKVKKYAVERLVKEGLAAKKAPESFPKFLKLYDRPRISVRGWDNEDTAPNSNSNKVTM